MDKYINPLLCVSAVVLGVILVMQYRTAISEMGAARVQYVQQACDAERVHYSAVTSEACGAAQNEMNSEYLCNSAGTSCWVEVK